MIPEDDSFIQFFILYYYYSHKLCFLYVRGFWAPVILKMSFKQGQLIKAMMITTY